MIAGIVLVSVVAIFVTLAFSLAGPVPKDGIFPLITTLPVIGLPLGFALLVVLLIMSAVNRGRAAKDDRN